MSAAASEEDDVVILPTQPHELIDLTDSPEPAGGENCTNSAARKRPADAIPISDGDRAGDDTPPPASRELIFKSPKKEKKGLKEEELGGGAAVQNAAPPASDLQDRLLRHFANSTHTWTAGELAVTLDAPWRDVGCALSRLALSHGLVSADAGGERAWSAPPSGIKLEPGVKKQAASGVKVEAAAAGAAGPAALAAAAAFAAAAAAAAAPQAAPAALGRRERKAKFKSSVSRPVVQLAELPQSQHSSTPLLLGSGLYARFVPGLQPQVPQLQLMNAAAEALLRPSTGQLANVGWLEAPTGTGKSLALLTVSLAHQAHIASRSPAADVPVIFFCTRTLNQLDSLTREFRRLAYRPLITTLASRARFCLHPPALVKGADRAHECELAMYKERVKNGTGCKFVEHAERSQFPAADMHVFQPGGALEAPEIEESVRYGMQHTLCPFHSARDVLGEGAGLVLVTYSQLLNPAIRSANNLNLLLRNATVVFDEAHNVASVGRECATLTVSVEGLTLLIMELARYRRVIETAPPSVPGGTAAHLATLAELSRIAVASRGWLQGAVRCDYNPSFHWEADSGAPADAGVLACIRSGDEALHVARGILGLTAGGLARLRKAIREFRAALIEANQESTAVKSHGINALEEIVTKYEMMLGASARDFKLVLRRLTSAEQARVAAAAAAAANDDEVAAASPFPSATFMCLSGCVAVKPILESADCVLFASGTLPPPALGAAELGLGDPSRMVCVSTSHHAGVHNGKQLLVLAVASAKDRAGIDRQLTFTHGAMHVHGAAARGELPGTHLFEALGTVIVEVLRRSPGGALIFFPSATVMRAFLDVAQLVGGCLQLLAQITSRAGKRHACVLVDEPGSGAEASALTVAKFRAMAADETEIGCSAVLFSVMRGVISEGADFSGAACRTVIVVGVPLPPLLDLGIRLKRQYQDEHFPGAETNGAAFYMQEGLRCASQAMGRVIRHASDFGCAVLVDSRYCGGGSGGFSLDSKLPAYCARVKVDVGPGESTTMGQALSMVTQHFEDCRTLSPPAPPPPAAAAAAAVAPAAISKIKTEFDQDDKDE